MSERNGSRPAFPQPYVPAAKENYYPACDDPADTGGISIREWFAGKALQGILAYPGDGEGGSAHNNSTPDAVARLSYKYADAMLEQRDK